jgi:hypothetical protein
MHKAKDGCLILLKKTSGPNITEIRGFVSHSASGVL